MCIFFAIILVMTITYQCAGKNKEHIRIWRVRTLCAKILESLTEDPNFVSIRRTCFNLPVNITKADK